jgi:hypothetical protein
MHLAELQRKLLAAARAHPPEDRVPYAFEQRVVARLQSRPPLDYLELWARGLVRGAAACLALTLLLGALAWLAPSPSSAKDLSRDFEATMLAAVNQDSD